jgi:hypothetical protein
MIASWSRSSVSRCASDATLASYPVIRLRSHRSTQQTPLCSHRKDSKATASWGAAVSALGAARGSTVCLRPYIGAGGARRSASPGSPKHFTLSATGRSPCDRGQLFRAGGELSPVRVCGRPSSLVDSAVREMRRLEFQCNIGVSRSPNSERTCSSSRCPQVARYVRLAPVPVGDRQIPDPDALCLRHGRSRICANLRA